MREQEQQCSPGSGAQGRSAEPRRSCLEPGTAQGGGEHPIPGCIPESPPKPAAPANAPSCPTADGPQARRPPLHITASGEAAPSRKPPNPAQSDGAPLVAPQEVQVWGHRPHTISTPQETLGSAWWQGTGLNNPHCSHTLSGGGLTRRCWPNRGSGTHQGPLG